MSGSDLRDAAILGDHTIVRSILKDRANVCSADEFGLTALMYATWNAHLECVKLLASNPLGIDEHKQRASSISMVSCKGYTALHILALDGMPKDAAAIAFNLLMLGLDQTIRCKNGCTAYEIAQQEKRYDVIEAVRDFNRQEADFTCKMELDIKRRNLLKKYRFIVDVQNQVVPWKADFPVPEFIMEKQRVGAIPSGMLIHEKQIKPLIEEGFNEMEGVDSIHCLTFTKNQSAINKDRREKLIKAGYADWEAPTPPVRQVKARRRGAKRVEEVFDEDGNVVYGSPTGPNNADGDISKTVSPVYRPLTHDEIIAEVLGADHDKEIVIERKGSEEDKYFSTMSSTLKR